MNVQNFRSYGYECPTELTEVLCSVMLGVNTPGVTPRFHQTAQNYYTTMSTEKTTEHTKKN